MKPVTKNQPVFVVNISSDDITAGHVIGFTDDGQFDYVCVKNADGVVYNCVENRVFTTITEAEKYLADYHTNQRQDYMERTSDLKKLLEFCLEYVNASKDEDAITVVKNRISELYGGEQPVNNESCDSKFSIGQTVYGVNNARTVIVKGTIKSITESTSTDYSIVILNEDDNPGCCSVHYHNEIFATYGQATEFVTRFHAANRISNAH